jgi:hypothetical protein
MHQESGEVARSDPLDRYITHFTGIFYVHIMHLELAVPIGWDSWHSFHNGATVPAET